MNDFLRTFLLSSVVADSQRRAIVLIMITVVFVLTSYPLFLVTLVDINFNLKGWVYRMLTFISWMNTILNPLLLLLFDRKLGIIRLLKPCHRRSRRNTDVSISISNRSALPSYDISSPLSSCPDGNVRSPTKKATISEKSDLLESSNKGESESNSTPKKATVEPAYGGPVGQPQTSSLNRNNRKSPDLVDEWHQKVGGRLYMQGSQTVVDEPTRNTSHDLHGRYERLAKGESSTRSTLVRPSSVGFIEPEPDPDEVVLYHNAMLEQQQRRRLEQQQFQQQQQQQQHQTKPSWTISHNSLTREGRHDADDSRFHYSKIASDTWDGAASSSGGLNMSHTLDQHAFRIYRPISYNIENPPPPPPREMQSQSTNLLSQFATTRNIGGTRQHQLQQQQQQQMYSDVVLHHQPPQQLELPTLRFFNNQQPELPNISLRRVNASSPLVTTPSFISTEDSLEEMMITAKTRHGANKVRLRHDLKHGDDDETVC